MALSDKVMLGLIACLVIVVLSVTAWMFLIKKEYPFVVEAECNPAQEICYARSCSDTSNTGDCPPNDLENYKIYVINAADFARCTYNSCAIACGTGAIACEERVCGEDPEDLCTEIPATPEPVIEPEE